MSTSVTNMNTETEEDDVSVALVMYMNLMNQYWDGRIQKLKKENRRTISFINRPLVHCVGGYNSPIFQAVVERNDAIVRRYLRLSVNALEKIVRYTATLFSSNRGWQQHFFITVFLYWLACGASYRITGDAFNVSKYTVRHIVHKCLDVFQEILPHIIKYPPVESYKEIGMKFNRRGRTNIFGRALGVIDGIQVKVAVPTRRRDQYLNRKLQTSIQLQVVCSSSGEFLSICVGYPGSVHDERVLRNSQIFRDRIFPPPGCFLLGDNGYKSRMRPIAIVTPFKKSRQLSEREVQFNSVHSKARTIMESSFGLLKNRWKLLFDKALQLNIKNCIKTIAVICILHNICLNDGFEDEREILEEIITSEDDDIQMADDNEAIEFRRTLAQSIIA